MKRFKFILPIIALVLFSCDSYLDINESPNDPQAAKVTPNLALAGVQNNTYKVLVRRMNEIGNVFMNNWGANVNAFTGGYAEEFGITMSNNFYEDIWNSLYRDSYDYTNIINYPSADYDNHKAIAKILKSFYFQYLVDLYGDIPYTQAHMGVDNTTPSYDDDYFVYKQLISQIDEAIAMIDSPSPTTTTVGAEDIMLGGDMQEWKKFANTVKLRMLLRMSTKAIAGTDASLTTYVNDQFAALNTTFVDSDVTINPGYSDASNSKQNPWMNLMVELKLTSSGAFSYRTAYNFRRATDFIASKLNGAPVDPRRGRLFGLVSGSVVGVIQGDASAPTGTAPASLSPLGPGLVISNDQDGYVMLLAESLLLQAEAVEKGYITGNAQSLFDAAIVASCNQLGATVGSYVTDVNAIPGKGYAASTDKLEAIMYQKSIALNGINGAEIWIEYTRTGYINNIPMPMPNGVPASSPTGQKPLRLMYPTSELSSNSANVPAQSANDAFTTAPFWKI